jgi:hemerythrin superfamily protein
MAKSKSKKAPMKAAGKKAPAKTAKKPVKKAAPKTNKEDIIEMILHDHKALKKLIKVMKNSDKDLSERQEAFEEFAPLLVVHAKPEEQTMYVFMKDDEDLREEGFEGDVEHGLADQLLEEIKRTDDEDLWGARVKVLAELVEHHIEEEEDELLPDFRKHSDIEERVQMGAKFMELKHKLEEQGGKDTVEEDVEYEEDEEEIRHHS